MSLTGVAPIVTAVVAAAAIGPMNVADAAAAAPVRNVERGIVMRAA